DAAGRAMRFIVDPIDGTRAFIRGLPTWSVLVGLEAESVPSIGIAYMPAAEELYVGVRGLGADCNGRPLAVSSVASLDDALVCHASLQHFVPDGLGALLPKLGEAVYTCRGLAAFDGYRQVLHGRADAMLDPSVQPYDVCPAAVLVTEAGGRFSALDGRPT